ncbi:NAD-dependent epimerase/dehydratase family protein [Chloroflexota bacterium]
MAILVTGASGIIGVNITKLLAEQGRNVVAFDRRKLPAKPDILGHVMDYVTAETGNVVDWSQVLHVIKSHHVNGIIHCAAILGKDANRFPLEAININMVGSANMLEAARIMGLGRVLIVSSSGVVGWPKDLVTPRKEEEIVLPSLGLYPLTKLACEHLTYTYRQIYGVDAISVRPRGVYGPAPTETAEAHANPIWQLVLDAAAGKPIRRETGGDGAWDLTYAKDCAKGIVQAYDCKSPSYHVYNLSYGKNTKISTICGVLKELFPDLPIEVGPGPWGIDPAKRKPGDLTFESPLRPPQDITRARTDFGFEPEWPVERAIPDWVQWLKVQKP